ncbi:MAG: tRNA preQ1(34) S-adenosylmethionine ribosyltransferase-isomerase QueA [Armatimonadota bacterium]
MRLSDFDYDLPTKLIAQTPPAKRDESRLLILGRTTGSIEHKHFSDILDYLRPDDLLVMNDTQVSAVRILGERVSGGKVEALLLDNVRDNVWSAMVKPGRKIQPGSKIEFGNDGLAADVLERTDSGGRILDFGNGSEVAKKIMAQGQVPLPPYIQTILNDSSRYQTVYASEPGSAAAPTAGFHFTPELLEKAKRLGVSIAFVTLHVGIATFRPVRTDDIDDHVMHHERISISEETAEKINTAKGRIISVGTTTARVLESAAISERRVEPINRDTNLFITPGYDFKIFDGLITNFHMPKSTLLILVSSFAGRDNIINAYNTAREEQYRFLSFGDAMFII